MANAETKTKKTENSVEDFIKTLPDNAQKSDSQTLIKMMEKVTRAKAKMWGASIIGFGKYHYKYASGREGDWFLCGFSPRKGNLSLYICPGLERFQEILDRIGKYKAGKGCLYIKKMTDIDASVLEELLSVSLKAIQEDNNFGYGQT